MVASKATVLITHWKTQEEIAAVRVLTEEVVNEQIKGFITPLPRQLEEVSSVVQEMVTTPLPSQYPRADYSAISGASVHQPDNR